MKKLLSLGLPLILTACGGGGSDSGSSPSISASSANTDISVTLSASESNPYQGTGFTLSWTSNAKSCTASGDWTGSLDPTGSKSTTTNTLGSTTYTINCVDGNKSGTASVSVTTRDKPYFVEVPNAFPDPTDNYWFFDKSKPGNRYPGQAVATASIDLNNDGKKEFIMVLHKGLGHDLYFAQYVSDPCKTTTVVYELNGEVFVDATDKYLETNRDFGACVDMNSSTVDINGDGKLDIFFSANQEDGRLSDAGSYMSSQLVGWVSQPNGKYKIVKFGEYKWHHSIGWGIDDSNKVFVTGNGYPSSMVNTKHVWNNTSLVTSTDTSLPIVSPVSFLFQSINGSKSSNVLIQQTFAIQYGAEAYVKQNGVWRKLNMISPSYKFVGEETFTVWNGDKRKVQVLNIDGQMVVGTGGGTGLDSLCNLKLYKDKDPVAVGAYTLSVIDNYVPGAGIKETQVRGQNAFVSFSVENNLLQYKMITIKGETNFDPGKIQCMDVNGDGYDDIVVGIGRDKSITSKRIYLNKKDGTFEKVNLGTSGLLAMLTQIDLYGSHMADFNNDGVMDVVIYPSNPGYKPQITGSFTSMHNSIKFYKGFKALQ